jgi:hypothetical protein
MKSPLSLGDRHSEVAAARRELRLVQRLMHETADGEPILDVVALSGVRSRRKRTERRSTEARLRARSSRSVKTPEAVTRIWWETP